MSWLLWNNPDNSASLWELNAAGSVMAYYNYGPYNDAPANPSGIYKVAALALGQNGALSLLWNNTDHKVVLWNVQSNGSFSTIGAFGPYTDGPGNPNYWSATAVAIDTNGVNRILWNNPDGKALLWTVDGLGNAATVGAYGPYTDGAASNVWTAAAFCVGSDNITRLVWNNTDGRVALWTVDGGGNLTVIGGYGPYTDGPNSPYLWSATGVATGSDGITHLLWNNPDGKGLLWNIDGSGNFTVVSAYGPIPNWSARAVTVGGDNRAHLLWGSAIGEAAHWTVNTDGTFTAVIYPSVAAISFSAGNVTGGGSVTGTVTLNAPALAGGALVNLSSNNTGAATVPANVTVPVGAITATFPISTSATPTGTSAVITASYENTSPSATLNITPTPPVLSGIRLSPLMSRIRVNTGQQFTASTYDQFGRPFSYQPSPLAYTWRVNGGGTISTSGYFSATGPAGSYQVAALLNNGGNTFSSGAFFSTYVYTAPTLTGISISPTSANVLPGGTQQYAAIANYSDGTFQNITNSVSWSSTGGGVSTSGLFTAGNGTGTYLVIATYQGYSTSVNVVISSSGTTGGGSGGGGSGGTPSGIDPYFNVSGGHLDVTQGASGTTVSGTTSFTVNPSNGFTGTLTPSITGLPPGVTAAFSPATLTISNTSSVSGNVTFSVPNSVLPGFYPLMLQASSGSIADSDSLDLNIIPTPNYNANYSLSLDSDVVEMSQATTQTVNLTLSPGSGFSGTVSLSLADDPTRSILQSSGSAPFSQSVLSSSSTTTPVTLQIGSGIPEGAYHLMITGTGSSGVLSIPLTILVLADDSNGVAVSDPTDNASTPPYPLAATISDTLRVDLTGSQTTLMPFLRLPQEQTEDQPLSSLLDSSYSTFHPHSVIGNDNFIRVKDVYPNFDFPYSTVCRIVCYYDNGGIYFGTGTLVGYNHVLTAGHVMMDENGNYCHRIRVYPAYDNKASVYYGSAQVKRYHLTKAFREGFTVGKKLFDDYALLDLYRCAPRSSRNYRNALGYRTGYLPMAADFNGMSDSGTVIAGYPDTVNQMPTGCLVMYYSKTNNGDDGPVVINDPAGNPAQGIVFHSIDTNHGDSGAGLRHPDPSGNYFYTVYGVHVRGYGPGEPVTNDATLITAPRLGILKDWMGSDNDDIGY